VTTNSQLPYDRDHELKNSSNILPYERDHELKDGSNMHLIIIIIIQTGFYMFIETSGKRTGAKARLMSPTYQPTTGKCLTFYYHMYGNGIGTLNILMKRQGQLVPPIWSRNGNQQNIWRIGQVNLVSSSPFQVCTIELGEGVGHLNDEVWDVALDIMLLNMT